jgi:pimeloyl-ACP methyl ester carboxylesterase
MIRRQTMTDTDIRPFEITIPQPELDDLRHRIRRTRWPEGLPDTGWSRGVPLDYLRNLARYWADQFDWRAQEDALNQLSQYITTIDGQDIHFIHVRSPRRDALPLVLTHGWPSSPFEFRDVIGPLTDPGAYGAGDAPAFHVIAPGLPGYGFSTPLRETGWGNLFRVAQAWAQLMSRLGYNRYAVHGTDAGSGVALLLPMVDPEHLVGVHLTGTIPAMPFGPPIPLDDLSGIDRVRAERFNAYQSDGLGYLHLQATRPQTLAYSLTDSPVGQLAWIVEKFREWTDPAVELPDEAVDRDLLLTQVSIAWFTGAGGSSAHATYEGMQVYRQMAGDGEGAPDEEEEEAAVPSAVAVFAADNTIRGVMDPQRRIDHWAEYERGGHFPAMEVPDLWVHDVRDFLRAFR